MEVLILVVGLPILAVSVLVWAGRKLLGGGTKAQRAAARRSYGGWGESSIDDLVAALEWAYERRAEAAEVGRRAASRMAAGGTWARAVENFARALREHPKLDVSSSSSTAQEWPPLMKCVRNSSGLYP